jgi:recombination protein RecT
MLRIAVSAINRSPKLQECTAQSLLRSVMEASILGLEIGVLGEGYLIPYKTECTFQPGYQGLLKLAVQGGKVASVQAAVVRPLDTFDYGLGSNPFVSHRPWLYKPADMEAMKDEQDRPTGYRMPEIIAAYCVVKLPSGEFQATIMSKAEVDLIRARSRAANDGPWVSDYEQMAIKTAIKRALKYVPKTPELARALEVDDRREIGQPTADVFQGEIPASLPGEAPPVEAGPKGTAEKAAAALGPGKTREPGEEG